MADRELAFAAVEIFKQIVKTLDQVLAIALQSGAQHFWIRQHEIRWCERIGKLLGVELDLPTRLRIEIFDLGDGSLQPVRGQQIGLLDEVENLIFLPVLVLETFVSSGWCDDRLDFATHHPARRAFPQTHIFVPKLELRLHHDGGIGYHAAQ